MSIVIDGVRKTFGSVQAVRETQLTVDSGEFITLLGPSGCGKTTLLRLIAGLELPDDGEITLGDHLVYSNRKSIQIPAEDRGLGMVFQDFALWPHLTVFENVAFGLRARKDTKRLKERVHWALDKVQLQGFVDRYPKQLSGGQQQRVSFARAIVTEPKIILLDEPLSALDAVLRDGLRLMLRTLTNELGLTAVYVTHDQHEAMSISDRIVVMRDGVMLQNENPEQVYNKPNSMFVANFIGKSNFIPLKSLKEHEHAMVRPEQLKLKQDNDDDLAFDVLVTSVSYLGDRYEVILELDSNTVWTAYLPKRVEEQSTVTIYISKDDIHVIQGGSDE